MDLKGRKGEISLKNGPLSFPDEHVMLLRVIFLVSSTNLHGLFSSCKRTTSFPFYQRAKEENSNEIPALRLIDVLFVFITT